ncbi:hypothetical protein [Mycobacterium sp. OAE908]|uniref:hypothetical protein n=1 Tax=Mycobacterium sp. OAE908 TaxID=2817899 RepID=UPI001AE2155B
MVRLVSALALAYIVWRPVSSGYALYPTLTVIAALALWRVSSRRYVAEPFVVSGLLFVFAGAIAAVIGSFNSAPGLSHECWVWFGSFIIWGLWAISLDRTAIRDALLAITITATLVGGTIVLYTWGNDGILPQLIPDWLVRAQGAGFSLTAEGSHIRYYSLSSLAAAAPLVTAGLLAGKDSLLPPRWLLAVASAVCITAALVSGRRAIAVVAIMAPIIAFLFMRALRPTPVRRGRPRDIDLRVVAAVPLLLIGIAIAANFLVVRRVLTAMSQAAFVFFDIGRPTIGVKGAGDIERDIQATQLLTAFAEKPLFGYGLGARLPSGYYRAVDRPYLFELQYHQLLFTSGLVGFALVTAAGVAAIVGIRRAARACPQHLPVLVASATGAAALLIVNASNPYLQAVGHGWGLALVVGVANALLDPQQRDDRPSSSDANSWKQKYFEAFGRSISGRRAAGRAGAIGGD